MLKSSAGYSVTTDNIILKTLAVVFEKQLLQLFSECFRKKELLENAFSKYLAAMVTTNVPLLQAKALACQRYPKQYYAFASGDIFLYI